MYKIRVFASFWNDNEVKSIIDKSFSTKFITKYGIDNDIYITDGDDYTHVIILNTAMPKLRPDMPKQNVIGLAYEPIYFLGMNDEFIVYAQKYIGHYFIGDLYGLPSPFIEGYSFLTYDPPSWIKYINDSEKLNISMNKIMEKKTKRMSIMVSHKKIAPGHIYRHKLVEQILNTNLPIDIYGNGCVYYNLINDPRIKGGFAPDEMCKMYKEYQFHIAIENFQSSSYVSEKIINPLLYGTTPLYLGCINVDSYLPNENIIKLTYDIEEDMKLIQDIIENPNKYLKQIDVLDIEKKVNLIKNLDNLFMR